MKHKLTTEAAADLEDAIDWYNAKSAGLGEKFRFRVLVTLRLIADNSLAFPIFDDPYRAVVVDPYPYLLVYDIREEMVRVVAVFHTSQHPGRLIARIQDASGELAAPANG